MLILEGRDYDVGQTVPVRARVQSAQFQPLPDETITIEVYDPTGKPMVPAPVLKRDANRREEYVGDFLAALPGRYKLELAIPDSRDRTAADISVTLPAPSPTVAVEEVSWSVPADGGGSLSVIVTVADAVPSVAPPVAFESVTPNVSFGSSAVSLMTGTVIVFGAVSPSAHVRVPLVAV